MLAFTEVREQILNRLFGVVSPAAQPAQRLIDHNAVQPGAKLRLLLELANSFKCGQKCVLERVVGIVFIPENAPGHDQQPAAVGANARFKGVVVTGLHPRQQGRFVQVRGGLAG